MTGGRQVQTHPKNWDLSPEITTDVFVLMDSGWPSLTRPHLLGRLGSRPSYYFLKDSGNVGLRKTGFLISLLTKRRHYPDSSNLFNPSQDPFHLVLFRFRPTNRQIYLRTDRSRCQENLFVELKYGTEWTWVPTFKLEWFYLQTKSQRLILWKFRLPSLK